MTSKWKEVVRLRFRGERFRDHALDLGALSELSQFQKMVAETAKVLWRAANPNRTYLPRHFEERTRLCLRRIEDGSATAPLEVHMEEEQQPSLIEPEPVEVNEAIALAYEVFEALDADTSLPDRLPRALIPEFANFGKTLSQDEEVEVAPPKRKPIRFTVVSRERLAKYSERGYEDHVDVTGHVLEADVKRQSFQLWMDEKTKATVHFTSQQEEDVTTALKEHERRKMRVKGWGKYSATGGLMQITRVDEMQLFPLGEWTFDLAARLIEDVLRELASEVPQEEWDTLPADLTDDLDHYLYGTPRK